jgi:5'-3' exonuclease
MPLLENLMGIRGLYTYLKHYRHEFDIRTTKGLRIGIDAMSFLYRYREDTRDIILLLQSLKRLDHRIFFVFDGKPPADKDAEIKIRKEVKDDAAAKASSIENFLMSESAKAIDHSSRIVLEESLQRCQARSWHVSRNVRRAFQDVLWDENIPYAKSTCEADDVLIDLYTGGKLDVIMSSDMDYLVAGVERLWIPSQKGNFWFEEIILSDVVHGETISTEQFIEAGILCTLTDVHCSKAFTWIRYYGSIKGILQSNTLTVPEFTMAEYELKRERLKAYEPYSRIRADHLERVIGFLDNL